MGADALAVGPQSSSVRIAAAEETRPGGRTHGVLNEGVRERRRFSHQFLQIRRPDIGVVEARDGVKALLIGDDPEDVRHMPTGSFAGRLRKAVSIGLRYPDLLRGGLGSRGRACGEERGFEEISAIHRLS